MRRSHGDVNGSSLKDHMEEGYCLLCVCFCSSVLASLLSTSYILTDSIEAAMPSNGLFNNDTNVHLDKFSL